MVRFDENDTPNKYGETKKERAIWNLIYSGKTLNDAKFKVTAEDKKFYEANLKLYNAFKEIKGEGFRFEHFTTDVD